jgi:hypothetical protein
MKLSERTDTRNGIFGGILRTYVVGIVCLVGLVTIMVASNNNNVITAKLPVESSTLVSAFDKLKVPALTSDAVITWENYSGMQKMVQRSWKGNLLCDILNNPNMMHEQPTTLLNITFDCQEVFRKSNAGTGNFIAAFYALRLAASVFGNVNVQMSCRDAVKEQTSLILPWLMGSFPARGGASHVVCWIKATSS